MSKSDEPKGLIPFHLNYGLVVATEVVERKELANAAESVSGPLHLMDIVPERKCHGLFEVTYMFHWLHGDDHQRHHQMAGIVEVKILMLDSNLIDHTQNSTKLWTLMELSYRYKPFGNEPRFTMIPVEEYEPWISSWPMVPLGDRQISGCVVVYATRREPHNFQPGTYFVESAVSVPGEHVVTLDEGTFYYNGLEEFIAAQLAGEAKRIHEMKLRKARQVFEQATGEATKKLARRRSAYEELRS